MTSQEGEVVRNLAQEARRLEIGHLPRQCSDAPHSATRQLLCLDIGFCCEKRTRDLGTDAGSGAPNGTIQAASQGGLTQAGAQAFLDQNLGSLLLLFGSNGPGAVSAA